MRSWPDRRTLGLGAILVGVAVLGLFAERERYRWAETDLWVPDLVVGWTLTGLGVAAAALRRPRGAAALLVTAGVAWYAGNFVDVEPNWLGSFASGLGWVFMAPLVHLGLAYPTGRPRTTLAVGAVIAVWLSVFLPWGLWGDELWTPLALGAFAAVGLNEWLRAGRQGRRDRRHGFVALLALVVWALIVPRVGENGTWDLGSLLFNTGIGLVGVWLFAGLRSVEALAERAIELDESAVTLRDALAGLVDDPNLRVGYALGEGSGFVDDAGRPVAPAVGEGSFAVNAKDGPVGLVVHDPAVLATDEDRRAVSVAVSLAAERARLREEVRLRADEVARSTLRLIRAGDDERTRLAARIAAGPGQRLRAAGSALGESRRLDLDSELEAVLGRAAEQLERASREVASFADGLGVPALEAGLGPALVELVAGVPFEVETRFEEIDCPTEIAATIWFVCAEGVSNVLKHAGASKLALRVTPTVSGVEVVVEDDGVGGVDAAGSGLVGLADRVAALGGALQVESPGGGTKLVATLPLTGRSG